MSRPRRTDATAEPAEKPWVVFLACRAKPGAPLRLAGLFGPTLPHEPPISFASEAHAAAWVEYARRAGKYANFVLTPGRLR